ncbi:MAG: hypothetical protein APF76_17840 [Desulfitibacter sp. BRH_c19]|nr:MAG: hypothetical protein APF76_17840 [Desulfitibacter sp. BRH_c19]
MTIMNSRERLLTAMRLGQPDRVPFFDAIDKSIQMQVMGKKDFTCVDLAQKLGMDAIGFDFFPPLFCVRKEIDGIDHVVDGLIKKAEDLHLMKLPDPDNKELYSEAESFIDKYGKSGYAIYARIRLGASPTLLSMGLDGFSYALYDNPDLVHEILDKYSNWSKRVIENLNEIGIDFYWSCDDLAYKTGPMFSPQVFRDVFLPYMKRAADAIKLPWIFHSDGNLMPLIEDLLSLKMSCLHPIEPGAMDIEQVKKTYGNKICLMGNIDLHYTLTQGTPDEVDEEVKLRINQAGTGGGYILSSANSIPNYVKVENLLAMAEAVKKYGKYPLDIDQ